LFSSLLDPRLIDPGSTLVHIGVYDFKCIYALVTRKTFQFVEDALKYKQNTSRLAIIYIGICLFVFSFNNSPTLNAVREKLTNAQESFILNRFESMLAALSVFPLLSLLLNYK